LVSFSQAFVTFSTIVDCAIASCASATSNTATKPPKMRLMMDSPSSDPEFFWPLSGPPVVDDPLTASVVGQANYHAQSQSVYG
jgi:hypothetical protein